MSDNLIFSNKNLNSQDYFNSKLYFDLEKYKKQNKENMDFEEEKEQKLAVQNLNNDNFTLQECLSKDLLEQIDSLSPEIKLKNEENINDNFNLDETNDSSIFHFSQKSGSIDEEIIQNEKIKENNTPLVDNNYLFVPKNLMIKKKKKKINNDRRIGDWICQFCFNLNFAFRIKCNRCGVLKIINENEKNKNEV